MVQKNLESNIWKYTLFLIANKRIFIAILGVYYLTIPDVTAQNIGLLMLISSLAAFLFEIPSGYIADKIGHKKALVQSRILMLSATTFYLISENFILLVIASIFFSVSHAFHSGTGEAFMHETLRGLGRNGDYAKVMGRMSAIGFAVPIVFIILTPFLVSISFKLPFVISLVTDSVGLIAALFLVVPRVSRQHIDEVRKTNFAQVMREGYHLRFFGLALFLGVIGGALIGSGIFRAPYQDFLAVPVIYYGVLFGIGRIIASLLLVYNGKIKEWTTGRSFFGVTLIFYTTFLFLLGSFVEPWIVVSVFILLNAFHWGISQVSKGYVLDIIGSSKFKATLLSVQSQVGYLIGASVSFGLGFAIERLGYQQGYLLLAIFFIILTIPLYIYVSRGVLKKVV